MADIDDVREGFVQLWGRLGPLWGISPTTARAFAWLLSKPEGVDGDTLAAELGMSRGAASMACRELIEWGLLHSERAPGSRRVTYKAEADLEKAIKNIVQRRKRREWDPILDNIREWSTCLKRDRSKEALHFRHRLEEVEGVVSMVDSLADSFLRGGIVNKLGLKAIVAGRRRARGEQR